MLSKAYANGIVIRLKVRLIILRGKVGVVKRGKILHTGIFYYLNFLIFDKTKRES